MKTNQKDLLIESIKNMDETMISELLDDASIYLGTTKTKFLYEFFKLFEDLKTNGDDFLNPNIGFCNSNDCSNKGCKGYAFVGNKSKFHFDWIFKDSVDDKIEICECLAFKTKNKSIKEHYQLTIDIKEDEKVNFKPSNKLLADFNDCELAIKELSSPSDLINGSETINNWLKKHFDFYQSLESPYDYTIFGKFYMLYERLVDLNDCLHFQVTAKNVLVEYEKIDQNNESAVLKWLIEYEIMSKSFVFFNHKIELEKPKLNDYFEIHDIKIRSADYWHIAKFKSLHENLHEEKRKKYTTFSVEQENQYFQEGNELSKYVYELEYHLKQRGIYVR